MLRPRRRANVRLDTRRGSYRLGLPLCWIQAGTSVPVELHGGPIGRLDLYSARPRDWDDSEIGAQQAYAGIAASSAAATHLKGRLADQPQAALAHGAVIGQANGVLMERERLDAPTAYERLRAAARSSSRKVADVARELLAGVPLPPNEPIVGGAAPHRGGWPGDQGGSHIRPGVSA